MAASATGLRLNGRRLRRMPRRLLTSTEQLDDPESEAREPLFAAKLSSSLNLFPMSESDLKRVLGFFEEAPAASPFTGSKRS